MAIIIALCNQKGGVGKTTSTVNLAGFLAAAEKKTLLIDLDPQGNATSGSGLDKGAIQVTIYQALLGEVAAEEAILPTELPCFHVLPATSSLAGAEVELAQDSSREQRLKEALGSIQDRYDYILIDCPPSLGLLTINALTAATHVVIPVQCEYYALEGLASLQETILMVKDHLNPDLDILGIILTMFDSRNNLAHQVAEEIRKHFTGAVFESIVPRNVRLSEAPSYGKPILLYDVRSKGAQSYLEVAQELMQRCEAILAPESGLAESKNNPDTSETSYNVVDDGDELTEDVEL